MKMDRQTAETGVESSAAFFAPTKAVASLSTHNSSEHLSSRRVQLRLLFNWMRVARHDRTRRPARASTRRHDRAPCAPESSAHCLNSASLSLSLGARARLRSNGGRSPRRARSTGSKKTTGHHSSLLGALAGLHASKNASSSSIARTYLHSHAITCNQMQSDAIACNPMACNQMLIRCNRRPSTARHPDIPSPQRCFSSHRRLSSAVLSATPRTYSERISPNLVIRGTQRTYSERISPNLAA
jgi:hypothetical protein